MKKLVVSILAVLYLGTSMGATISLHYCMGKMVGWALWNSGSSECDNCGMKKGHSAMYQDCCKDEFKLIQNDRDQKVSAGFTQLSSAVVAIVPFRAPGYSILLPVSLHRRLPGENTSPGGCVTPLHIINCVFRI